MTREEAEKYAEKMTYHEAIYNLKQAKSVPYRKATFIKIYELLDKLEQEPKWIPVTEKLPKEESNTYWVCTHNGCQCECRWTNVSPFWSYETTDWHWNTADIPQYTKVVAWMPLPKPYGLESEET